MAELNRTKGMWYVSYGSRFTYISRYLVVALFMPITWRAKNLIKWIINI
jgi:hypothetical protein